jgi:peptidoglycan/LPS O-acetylase OafA/YrhL
MAGTAPRSQSAGRVLPQPDAETSCYDEAMANAERPVLRLGYQPALDGVRGVAVLLVVVRHLREPGSLVGGGAVGVGLFFALSGFLITTLLVEERLLQGRVSLRAFYMRRLLRLMPALLAMLCAVVLLGWLLDVRGIWLHAAYAALYVGNWAQIIGGRFQYLAHTWSLGVEEHFYLLWPIALLVAWRWNGVRAARWVALGGAAAAIVLRVALLLSGASTMRLQYGSDTRADAILIGCAAALLTLGRRERVHRWAAPIAWGVLLGLLFLPPVSHAMLSAGVSVIAVCGAIIVADVASARSLLAGPLRWRPLVAIGRASYGLYLWHFPVIKLLLPRLDARMPHVFALAVVVLVFSTATVISYRLIEQPVLAFGRRRFAPRRSLKDRPLGLESAVPT